MQSKTFISPAQTIHVVNLEGQWLVTYSGRCSAGTSHSIIVPDSRQMLHFDDFKPREFNDE